AVSADDEARLHLVAAVRSEVPHLFCGIPNGGSDGGLKGGELVEVVFSGDGLAVREDLGALGVVILGHVVELVEQRQIVIGDDVARHAGVPVPVPCAADVSSALDDANALDAMLPQPRGGQKR